MKKHLLALVLLLFVAITTSQAQTKFITTKGKELIGTNGKPFLMKGTNLGNWLIPEGYMFKFKDINSPKLINEAFMEIMGPEDTKLFWRKYTEAYITEA